ncbi:hypothetical protein RRG08_028549 [Elysia crispata]|uniref:RNA transcription, translation and transport factor protein n=1 Tax=Elysia crispata TaxID=231223 RepID=A0AAE0Y9I8_9GAST|nr:hypothetical protein RRG08_028549 [Elysia crispata]
MFKRKLQALDFPDPSMFDIQDDGQFRSMVLWLEDQKIRHYKIEDRAGLRNFDSSNQWTSALQEYLTGLHCPYSTENRRSMLDWLLGYAVRLEYGDNAEKYSSVTPEKFLERQSQNTRQSSNPLENLDFNDPQFKAGVTSLSMMLKIPPHENHLEMLKAICLLVCEKFSPDAIAAISQASKSEDELIPLDQTALGFEAGDMIMTEVAKILRLLHIRDLRDLQTKINAAIVAVQAITANPKTDSRLGKVGR